MAGSRSNASVAADRTGQPPQPSTTARPLSRHAATQTAAPQRGRAASTTDRVPQAARPAPPKRQDQRQQDPRRGDDKAQLELARVQGRAPMRNARTSRSARLDQPDQAPSARSAAAMTAPPRSGRSGHNRTRQQPRAEAGLRAGRQLADDGADQADRDRDLQAGEQEGHARTASAACEASARGVAL